MYILENTILIQSLLNFVRMLIIIISRSDLKLGHVESKIRSLGQILEKPGVHSRGHSFDSKHLKLYQTVNNHNIEVKFETRSCWVKNEVARLNLKKTLCTL